ncbi:unnamed protein product [Ambrosiozyma monospora]|uniref:Unnamed protein product n=1 Tax=Ambrosiozyma monospora TaxID=43982 RepID=A0ACB5SSD6_AMBMO|nr:unnamed protein product [Ambrosiozyma monospora]
MVCHIVNSKEEKLEAPYLKLYSAGASPFAKKVKALLNLLKLDYHLLNLDFSKKEQKEPWFLEINPRGKVPVLEHVDSNGNKVVISESLAILNYIANKFDTKREFSFSFDDPLYYDALEWSIYYVSTFEPAKVQQFIQLKQPVEEQNRQILEKANATLDDSFGFLEAKLKKNNNGFLVGDHLSIVDLFAYPCVVFGSVTFDSEKFPFVKAWTEKLDSLKLFE